MRRPPGAGMCKGEMREGYLDASRSVIISSPAGSGKTEKLARRYISLLEAGSDVEKILCITFTEKAAAEMKERILGILGKERPELLERVRAKVPLMRISTIHAFCLRLLKRFSLELGVDPSLEVADDLTARSLWVEAVYESLMAERDDSGGQGGFFRMISERGIRGWQSLKRLLDELHQRSPYPEIILRDGPPQEGESGRALELYAECLSRYRRKKDERRLLDFNDLELLAYEALARGPQWHNILYSFDEHTDHVLVDEFQDTNTLQWRIIDKLTEEWRSGMGAKREAGKAPTIFLVGDEKQSIYQFRGANVSVFEEAKKNFAEWLGEDYHFEEARENYRSLGAITEFANRLFEKLMPSGPAEPWRTKYSPFEAVREGDGAVDMVLLQGGENTREARLKEAEALAGLMGSLHGRHEIYDGGAKRPCGYGDMAVLLRRRTHLGLFEDALRRHGIPFVVLKGIGFYDAPETAALRELVCFVADPGDSYSLFCVLRSPLFPVGYKALWRLFRGQGSPLERLAASESGRLREAHGRLAGWLERSRSKPLAVLLEEALTETGGWGRFNEKQRHANLKKFIAMVESLESEGLSALEIREKLLRQRHSAEVPKANINAEGMDAVRIMTIHAAKGLQFPMVFLPSMEESISPRSGPVAIDDEGGTITLGYEEDSAKRSRNETFARKKAKELEEEKRLFYVAVTRAMDYLCMVGHVREDGRAEGRLAYIEDAFGPLGDMAEGRGDSLPFNVLREAAIKGDARGAGIELCEPSPFIDEPAYVEPLSWQPEMRWRDVTAAPAEHTSVRARHGEGWAVLGGVMHVVFEELSKGILKEGDVPRRAAVLLKAAASWREDLLGEILKQMERLGEHGLLGEIIMPRPNSFAELPFVHEKGRTIFRGRMDRLILKNGEAHVYDYKTFPVRKRELQGLVENYRFQMTIYREAAQRLFSVKARSFLVFTHTPETVEV
jgi:ATP-dependent helicase/nuclease subunit A